MVGLRVSHLWLVVELVEGKYVDTYLDLKKIFWLSVNIVERLLFVLAGEDFTHWLKRLRHVE